MSKTKQVIDYTITDRSTNESYIVQKYQAGYGWISFDHNDKHIMLMSNYKIESDIQRKDK